MIEIGLAILVVALALIAVSRQYKVAMLQDDVSSYRDQVSILRMLVGQMRTENERLTDSLQRCKDNRPPASPWPKLGWDFSTFSDADE